MSLEAFRKNRAEEKKQAVVNAAVQLFSERGLQAVSMATLAKAAGVSTATLYRHFDTKQDVFASVVDHLVSRVISDAKVFEDSLTGLCHQYAKLFSDVQVIGCLRAVISEQEHAQEFRERLSVHGNDLFLNEFREAIRKRLPASASDEDVQQASLELRGAIEHFTLINGLLLNQTLPAPEVEKLVDRTLESWRSRWQPGYDQPRATNRG